MFKLISVKLDRISTSIHVPSYDEILAQNPRDRGCIDPFFDMAAAKAALPLVVPYLLINNPGITIQDLDDAEIDIEMPDNVLAIAGRPVYFPSVRFKTEEGYQNFMRKTERAGNGHNKTPGGISCVLRGDLEGEIFDGIPIAIYSAERPYRPKIVRHERTHNLDLIAYKRECDVGGVVLNELIAIIGEEASPDPDKDYAEVIRLESFWIQYVWKIKFLTNGLAKLLKLHGQPIVTLKMIVDRLIQLVQDLTKERVFGLSNSELVRLFMSFEHIEDLYRVLYRINPSYFPDYDGEVRFGIASEIDFLDHEKFREYLDKMRKVYEVHHDKYTFNEREIVFSSDDVELNEASLMPFIMVEKTFNHRLRWQIIKAALEIFGGDCKCDLRGIHFYKVTWSGDKTEVRVRWKEY